MINQEHLEPPNQIGMQNSDRLLRSAIFHSLVWFNVTPAPVNQDKLCISFKIYIKSGDHKKILHYVDYSSNIKSVHSNLVNMFKTSSNMERQYALNYMSGIECTNQWFDDNKSRPIENVEIFGFNRLR